MQQIEPIPAEYAANPVVRRRVVAVLESNARYVAVLFSAMYVAVFSYLSFYKFWTFRQGFDMALYEQAIWNTAHGRLFQVSMFTFTKIHLGVDLALFELFVAPVYRLWESPYNLLFLQTLTTGISGVAIYMLASKKLRSRLAGLMFAAAFLGYAPLENINMYELQPRLFAITLLLFAFMAYEADEEWKFWALAIPTIMIRTDVALVVAMFGVYGLVERKRKRMVFAPLLVGIGWFLASTALIVPALSTTKEFGYLVNYKWLGESPHDMLITAVTRPLYVVQNVFTLAKGRYLLDLFLPLLFLPLLRPKALIFTIPPFALNLLSSFGPQFDVYHQYHSLIVPFLFIAAMDAVAWLARSSFVARLRRSRPVAGVPMALPGIFLAAVAVTHLAFGSPITGYLGNHALTDRSKAANEILALVPPDAPLSASTLIGAHAAERKELYFFPGNFWYSGELGLEKATYIIGDAQRSEAEKKKIHELEISGQWRVMAEKDGFILLKRDCGCGE